MQSSIEYRIEDNVQRMGMDYHFFIPHRLWYDVKLDAIERAAISMMSEDVADILQNLQILAFRAHQQGLLGVEE